LGTKQADGSYASSRDDDIAAFKRVGMDFDVFLETQNAYTEINEQFDTAGEKALEFSRWVNGQVLTAEQQDTMRDCFKYYTQVPQEAKKYDSFVEAGFSDNEAYELVSALDELEPESGEDNVSNAQRYMAIAGLPFSDEDKLVALGIITGDETKTETGNVTLYGKITNAVKGGVSFYDTISVYDYYQDLTGDKKQASVWAYINKMPLTTAQKDSLHLLFYAESTLRKTPWH